VAKRRSIPKPSLAATIVLRSIGRFSHRRPQPVTVIALRQLRGRERLVESIISVTRFATLYRSKAK
jgi:hypothetical protein